MMKCFAFFWFKWKEKKKFEKSLMLFDSTSFKGKKTHFYVKVYELFFYGQTINGNTAVYNKILKNIKFYYIIYF